MTQAPQGMPQPGDRIGPYRLEWVAGAGGMGVVYRAADTLLHDRAVAVKVMAANLSREDAYRAAFLHEAHVAAEVNHPHVVPVHAAGEADGLLYLAMAWIDGEDLGRLRDAGLSGARALDATQQVARALQALHDAGIVHGDVKPTNVLVHRTGDEDHAYLVDFGVARRSEFADPRTNELVGGTPAYAAPETATAPPGPATDQYALGCVLYELLTGEKPFGGAEPAVLALRHASAPRPRVSDSRPGLAHLDEPVARAMAVDPADRFADAATFGRELAAAQRRADEAPTRAQAVPTAPARPAPIAAPRHPRRRAVPAAITAILVVIAAVIAVVVSGGGKHHTAAPAPAVAAARTRADRVAVARLARHYAAALNGHDMTLLAGLVSSAVVRRGSDGVLGNCVTDTGAHAALHRWRSELPAITGYRISGASSSRVALDGDRATLRAKFAIGNQPLAPVQFTARRQANGWRLTRVLLPPCPGS